MLDEFPRLLRYAVKVVWQLMNLISTVVFCPRPRCIVLQNPPAIPTLALCWIASIFAKSDFIIDWHNYGYTILGLAAGQGSALVKVARQYEKWFGRCSNVNICVTNAMREDLRENWGISAVTMYDRPPASFTATDVASKHKLFTRLAEKYDVFRCVTAEFDHNQIIAAFQSFSKSHFILLRNPTR